MNTVHSKVYPFKTEPFKHQLKAWSMSNDQESFALFMEMGTGKSKVILDTASYLYDNGYIDTLLIVAPKGAYRNWHINEIPSHLADHIIYRYAIWSASPRKKEKQYLEDIIRAGDELRIVIMNVEAFSSPKGVKWATSFLNTSRAMMVVDESTTIKNPTAKRTKAIIKLGTMAKYRRILTGEPVTRDPLDLYSQCEFLDEFHLGFSSFYTFRNRYAIMVNMNLGHRSFKKVTGFQRMDELNDILRKFSFRVKKDDCLDLPKKNYQYRYVDMTKEQEKAYQEMKDICMTTTKNTVITVANKLSMLGKLHQIVCGHIIDNNGETTYLKNNRIDALLELTEQVDNKCIIWACYRADLKKISSELREKYGTDMVVEYWGDTSDKERKDNIQAFTTGKPKFFVANPATAGFGLNLQAANTVIYYSNNYNLEHRLQSEDRCHRIGQKRNVHYIDITTLKTVDNLIIKSLKNKKNIATQVMGDQWKEWLR
jgi:SNF2 family DNA or RNA helicase|tara:strand:+ start:1547 stop:2995 length:1449 start_codon:yes stop_codon:yes gene_type:complete